MNLFERVYNKFFDNSYSVQRTSYSQSGEDLIVDFFLTWQLGIKNPTYMDIGAHHPYWLSNTYLFYKRGLTGVCIEPDPMLYNAIAKKRPKDININKGVGFNKVIEVADFYIMSSRALNTFSKEEAERVSKLGLNKIEQVIQIELININDIFSKYYPDNDLDFLSLDVEGLDQKILESIDFEKYKPKVICVETIEFNESRIIKKQQAIVDFLISMGYFIYADTSINTIFVRKDLFSKSK
jgi:FkbM family methyltransferase